MWTCVSWIFRAGYLSCHPTVGVPAQSTNSNQWPGLVFSWSPASLLTEGALLPLCWLSSTSTTHAARYCLIKPDSCTTNIYVPLSGPGRALSPVCVCVHTAAFEWNDLRDIWFAGSPWHCLRHIRRSRSWVRVHGHRKKSLSSAVVALEWLKRKMKSGKSFAAHCEKMQMIITLRISVWLGGGMHWTALVGCLWSSLF